MTGSTTTARSSGSACSTCRSTWPGPHPRPAWPTSRSATSSSTRWTSTPTPRASARQTRSSWARRGRPPTATTARSGRSRTPTTETGNIWKALTTEAQVDLRLLGDVPGLRRPPEDDLRPDQMGAQGRSPARTGNATPRIRRPSRPRSSPGTSARIAWPNGTITTGTSPSAAADGGTGKTGASIAPGLPASSTDPVKIGFHLPSWLSPFVSLSEIAASFLRGLSDINEFKDFHNKHLAEPWKLTSSPRTRSRSSPPAAISPAQTVPEAAIALTCGMDVQQYGFWFVVRAWAPYMTSWLIHYGFLATWEDVERLLFEYRPIRLPANSRPVPADLPGLRGHRRRQEIRGHDDDGGNLFLAHQEPRPRRRGLWGTKGSSSALPGMLNLGNGDHVHAQPGRNCPRPSGPAPIDTEKAKDQYHYRLQLAAKAETRDLPGAAFLHAGHRRRLCRPDPGRGEADGRKGTRGMGERPQPAEPSARRGGPGGGLRRDGVPRRRPPAFGGLFETAIGFHLQAKEYGRRWPNPIG